MIASMREVRVRPMSRKESIRDEAGTPRQPDKTMRGTAMPGFADRHRHDYAATRPCRPIRYRLMPAIIAARRRAATPHENTATSCRPHHLYLPRASAMPSIFFHLPEFFDMPPRVR